MNIDPSEFAFDFDGVVADTFRLFVHLAKSLYNYDINYDDITDYEFMNVINMEKQHAWDIIDIITHETPDIDLRPNKGAVDVLTRMVGHGPLLCVTARPIKEPIELWFEKYLPHIEPPCLKVEATGVNTGKLEVLKRSGIRFFVDDRLDTCQLLEEAGITPIVYSQPWNRKPHPYQVVNDWEELSLLMDWDKKSPQAVPCAGTKA
ncbi:MAG: haloacid dehalogenase [Syntrophaceae bacterium]|nr:haloacid dehalogenase [Deltaproteobacteria bacterium]